MLSTYKKPNYNVRTKVLYQMVPSDNQSHLFLFFILYLQIFQHPSLMLHMTYQCPFQRLYFFLFIPKMNSVHFHFNNSIPTLLCHFPFNLLTFLVILPHSPRLYKCPSVPYPHLLSLYKISSHQLMLLTKHLSQCLH